MLIPRCHDCARACAFYFLLGVKLFLYAFIYIYSLTTPPKMLLDLSCLSATVMVVIIRNPVFAGAHRQKLQALELPQFGIKTMHT